MISPSGVPQWLTKPRAEGGLFQIQVAFLSTYFKICVIMKNSLLRKLWVMPCVQTKSWRRDGRIWPKHSGWNGGHQRAPHRSRPVSYARKHSQGSWAGEHEKTDKPGIVLKDTHFQTEGVDVLCLHKCWPKCVFSVQGWRVSPLSDSLRAFVAKCTKRAGKLCSQHPASLGHRLQLVVGWSRCKSWFFLVFSKLGAIFNF